MEREGRWFVSRGVQRRRERDGENRGSGPGREAQRLRRELGKISEGSG